jgi:WD40 repeat protein/tRNA A-37 threonylcarbamoyl transferase component Bud32/type II secretory pathway pseudopilin PulG
MQQPGADNDPDRTMMPPVPGSYRMDARLEAGMMVGHYKITRLLGEGGMGAVYEAEQDQPRRTVALKVIKPGLASPLLLRRFEQESHALGRLQHVGIAQIYEAGTADTGFGPQPYFAMEFIRGKTLLEYANERSLHFRERMEIMAKVADAVQHAHQRGLIHRDLKPGNILVDDAGQPKILDFGVARATDSDSQATMQTDIGQLVGTLAYMSPEQVVADPLELDTRSDVYALGVILYELLAGRMPYAISKKLHETIQAIREQEGARLSSISRNYRGDIETIVAKALEKDKTRRYGSAAELAADIGHYLKDEPIVARPASAAYQLQKFARRHTGLVVGIVTVFVVLVAGVVASTWQASVARRERDRARVAEQSARDAEQLATKEQKRAVTAEGTALQERDRAFTEQQRADTEAETARTQRILTIWQTLSRESARDAAGRIDDDRTALLARQALLFHSRTQAGLPQYLVELALQQASRPDPMIHIPGPNHSGAVFSVAFSPDGTRLASGSADRTVQVWDLRSPSSSPLILSGHDGNVYSVAFSSDGFRLATSSADKFVRVWDLRTPTAAPLRVQGPQAALESLAFSRDGSQLAAASLDKTIRIWNLRDLPSPPAVFEGHEGGVNMVVFSPDGLRIASASDDKTMRLWNARDSKASPVIFRGHDAPVLSLSFSPDGSRLATGSADRTTRIWNVQNPSAAPSIFRGQENAVLSVVFSADGTKLASAGKDHVVRVWDARNTAVTPRVVGGSQSASGVSTEIVNALALSADLSRLASAGEDKIVRVFDLRSSATQPVLLPGPQGTARFGSDNVHTLAYSADGGRLASASRDNTVRIWDLRNPDAQPVVLQGQQGAVTALAFTPDGRHITSVGVDRSVREWDLRNPANAPVLVLGPQGDVRSGSVAFSSSGLRLATAARDNVVRFWANLHDAQPVVLKGQQSAVATFVFSHDGMRLASAGIDNKVRLWDLRKPALEATVLEWQQGAVLSIAFSHDGTLLATGGGDRSVRVWDLQRPDQRPTALQGSESVINSVAFSPDGLRLAAGGVDRTVRMWDLRSPEAPPVRFEGHESDILSVVFSPDGLRLAAGGLDGSVRAWHLWSAAADYLCTRVWRNLSTDEWRFYIGEDIPYEQTCPAIPSGKSPAKNAKNP